jgi:hypothetical protein
VKTHLLPLLIVLLVPLAFADELPRSPQSDAVAAALQRERAAKSRKALQVCRDLPGYQTFQESFQLEDATLGLVNSMPESLFVELRSTKPRTIDAAWWWNPLTHKKPSLTWREFLAAYEAAERVVSKHPWLAEHKGLVGERSLEFHLLGTRVGVTDDELGFFYLPAWKHAGMVGKPAYRFLARRGNHSWIEFLFSDQDERAFVRSTSIGDPAPQSALDRLDVSWHPRGKRGESYSQYGLVESDGRLRVQTFVADER